MFRPFRNAHGTTVKGKETVFSHVPHLFMVCCPSTIIRRVVSIVIDAVNAVLVGRAISHIPQKRRKTIPSTENLYPSAAPHTELLVTWVVASASHVNPRSIFWKFSHAVLEASARVCVSTYEVFKVNLGMVSTRAFTQPFVTDFRVFAYGADGDKFSKSSAGYVFSPTLKLYKVIEHHVGNLCSSVVRWRPVWSGRSPIISRGRF